MPLGAHVKRFKSQILNC